MANMGMTVNHCKSFSLGAFKGNFQGVVCDFLIRCVLSQSHNRMFNPESCRMGRR
jgi:hypothetical protein